MNERITELKEQAKEVSHWLDGGYTPVYDTNLEKFAELIVGECLTQVDKVNVMLDDPKEKLGASWVGLAIAKHFGLE